MAPARQDSTETSADGGNHLRWTIHVKNGSFAR